jgi:hypothetical protein
VQLGVLHRPSLLFGVGVGHDRASQSARDATGVAECGVEGADEHRGHGSNSPARLAPRIGDKPGNTDFG